MTAPETTTTHMALRKREAPTTTLVMHRDALISRFNKRPRTSLGGSHDGDNTETDVLDEADSSDTESDYEERPVRTAVATSTAIAARVRTVPTEKASQNEGASPTDKSLTFLQSAQLQNNPVRSGKWNEDEEAYLRKLVHVFNSGILDGVEAKMSMRMWLAKMLHCCPMRISKKQMHGEKFKGKAKYLRNSDRIERMVQKEFDRTWQELDRLRSNFLKFWAKEEFGRWGSADRSRDFGQWYDTVVGSVPKPRLAKNARLVEPIVSKTADSWAILRKDLDALSKKKDSAVQERDPKRRLVQRPVTKKRTQATTNATQQPSSTACQETRCAVSTLDFSVLTHDNIFESIESTPLEIEVDLAALVTEWEGCVSPSDSIPTKPISEVYTGQIYPSQLLPSIVLDFGPPSMWDVDPIAKDVSCQCHCELVDDLLSDDELLAFDPAMLTTSDLPLEPWFQQLCTTFQL